MKLQHVGIIIVAVCLVILGLLIFTKIKTDAQLLNACTQSCGEAEGASCSIASCPYHQGNDLSWVLIVASILVAFLGGTGIYLSLPKRAEKLIEEKEYDLSRLSEEEKEVFLFIKNNRQGVYQSHIVEHFNLTKVQATRLLDTLEGSGLIERKRRGLANVVLVK